jgi:hypothetical protein
MGTVEELSDGNVAFRAGSVMTLTIALSISALIAWIFEWGHVNVKSGEARDTGRPKNRWGLALTTNDPPAAIHSTVRPAQRGKPCHKRESTAGTMLPGYAMS